MPMMMRKIAFRKSCHGPGLNGIFFAPQGSISWNFTDTPS